MGWVDLHLHLLPGIDDGPIDIETSVDLGAGLFALGFDTLVATPHVRPGVWDGAPEEVVALARVVEEALLERLRPPGNGGDVGLRVHTGGEHFIDAPLIDRMDRGKLLEYPRDRGLLVELTLLQGASNVGLREIMFRLRVNGLRPVLAHPERYDAAHKSIDWLEQLRDDGVAMLGDLMSLAGKSGRASRKTLEKLLDRELVDGMSTDAHGTEDLRVVEESLRLLEKETGRDRMSRLLTWGRTFVP